ncbi:MAG: hypothetical protein ACI9FR_001026 [Cryomorphaceae bacterium]
MHIVCAVLAVGDLSSSGMAIALVNRATVSLNWLCLHFGFCAAKSYIIIASEAARLAPAKGRWILRLIPAVSNSNSFYYQFRQIHL